jgi:hypothetical protein
MTDQRPLSRRVLVVVAETREARDRVARALAARFGAPTPAERCTCPMSLRAHAVHSIACPCRQPG